MQKYRHIFIDLDRTLWDFDMNARDALEGVFDQFGLQRYFLDKNEFVELYHKHNERLWMRYREGNIKKDVLRSKRFDLTLKEKKVKDKELAEKIGEDYLRASVEQTRLFPNTHEILDYLMGKYSLYILTNGFRETQFSKLRNCDLEKYFTRVFTSETIGYNKPHPRIFHWALSSVNALKEESIMIGDDQEVDIKGGSDFGIHTVFFNPTGETVVSKPTYTIRDLIELKEIL